jgi:hypothetical protein
MELHHHHRKEVHMDNDAKHHDPPKRWAEYRAEMTRPWALPFYAVDWACAHLAYRVGRWSILRVLEHAGSFSILVAVIFWIAEAPERTQQRHYQAWQVINTAQGKGGSGGRLDALEQLNEDHVPLVGVDVAEAYLQDVKLEKAELRRASFRAADLRKAHLKSAKMEDSSFRSANLRGADLRNVDLSGADLIDCDMEDVNLAGANLHGANFAKADLRGVDFSGATDWQSIESMNLANIDGIKNAPKDFVVWAISKGAVQFKSTQAWNAAMHHADEVDEKN